MTSVKNSDVYWLGKVASDWEIAPAWRVMKERGEKSLPDDVHLTPSQTHGVLTQQDYMDRTGNKVVLNLAGTDNMKRVRAGDFIIHLRSFQGGIEASAIDGKVSNAYTVLTPAPDAHFGYYRWFMKSVPLIEGLASSTDQLRDGQSINFSRFSRLSLPLPPFETQQRIADYLDRETAEIDAAVADLDRYVELLNVKLGSASREVFTELSANHPLIQTKFLVDITTGSGDTQDSQENGGFPFYVRSDTIQRAEDFEFDCDAVLTSGDGAGVGKIFHLAGGKFKAHQRVYVMHNFKRVSPQYFYWMFKSAFPDAIRYGGAKSTVDSVRRPMIANLKIPVPDHDAQEKASKRIEKLHHEVSALIAKSTKLRDLLLKRRSVLITEVVTGRKQV